MFVSILLSQIIFFVAYTQGLPSNYCLHPINLTDCGGPPIPVFSYYKPGSRCEIEIWRGCPSYNRFDNEVTCSHYCIARFNFVDENGSEDNDQNLSIENDDNSWEPRTDETTTDETVAEGDPCTETFNADDCGQEVTKVYTYNHDTQTCEEVDWRGCKSRNKFPNEINCMDQCLPHLNATEWENEVQQLSSKEVHNLEEAVDNVLADDHKNSHEELKGSEEIEFAFAEDNEPAGQETNVLGKKLRYGKKKLRHNKKLRQSKKLRHGSPPRKFTKHTSRKFTKYTQRNFTKHTPRNFTKHTTRNFTKHTTRKFTKNTN